MNSKLLTIDQVADYLGVHRDTVSSLIRAGRLPALQLGGRKSGWRITEEDVQTFIRKGKAAASSDMVSNEQARDDFARKQSSELETFLDAQRREREDFHASRGQGGRSS